MTTTIVLSNVPADLFARLSAQAARSNRTVEEVCLSRITALDPAADPGAADALTYIPSPEIPAPFDLGPTSPGVRVSARVVPPPPLEFWYDEDKVGQ